MTDQVQHDPEWLKTVTAKLTERQRDCLLVAAQGYRVKEVALRLKLSPETVKQHLSAARRLYGVGSSIEAARLFSASIQALPYPPKEVDPSPELVDPTIRQPSTSSREWRRRLGPVGWLIPAHRGAANNLTVAQRVSILVVLPLILIVIAAGALATYEVLLRLLTTQ